MVHHRFLCFAILLASSVPAGSTYACNIPVFRYALERWTSDNYEIVVYRDRPLDGPSEPLVQQLEDASQARAGKSNLSVTIVDVNEIADAKLQSLWTKLQPQATGKLPFVAVRTRAGQLGRVTLWSGALADLGKENLLSSPARTELQKRLLAGHAVVWLMIKSSDESRNRKIRTAITKQFQTLSRTVKLPDGIGLPGSELYAEVPLLMKFSLLEVDPKDDSERYLIQTLGSFEPDALAEDQPILAPVFGRGRALRVVAGDRLNPAMVADMTAFLSGPCSCQVKNQNPGFDLLLSADWQAELFGTDGDQPPDRSAAEGRNKPPTLLTIPPGRKKK